MLSGWSENEIARGQSAQSAAASLLILAVEVSVVFHTFDIFYAFDQQQLRQTSTCLRVLVVLCCSSSLHTDRCFLLFFFHFRNVYRCALSFQDQS